MDFISTYQRELGGGASNAKTRSMCHDEYRYKLGGGGAYGTVLVFIAYERQKITDIVSLDSHDVPDACMQHT